VFTSFALITDDGKLLNANMTGFWRFHYHDVEMGPFRF